MRTLLAVLLVVLAPLCLIAAGADWPQFRGPTGQGVSPAKSLPTTWSDEENIVWKQSMPGPGTSAPSVFGDKIFVTAWTGYNVPSEQGSMEELKLHLICLDRKTGKQIWKQDVAPKLPEQDRIREEHGYASSTPAIDSERIYVFLGKTGVLAYSHAGKKLWQTNVGEKLHGWGSAASPVLYKDLVIVNASVESESLVALNKKTGEEVWRLEGINESWNTPILVSAGKSQSELVLAKQGHVLGIDPASGEELWRCATDIGWYMVPSLVEEKGVVYCIGGRSGVASLAVRVGGRGDVTETHRLWTTNNGSNVSSPLVYKGHLYFMNDNNSIAFCLEGKTGKTLYEERVPRADQIYASPLLGDGKIYYLSRSGRTFVVAAKPEFELLATNRLEERGMFNASPAIDGNRLLIRSNKFLYCIGE